MKKAILVYCSPSGSTRHVVQTMAKTCKDQAISVTLLDLGISKDPSSTFDLLKTAGSETCLFIGSPVYQGLAVPPVMNFLAGLPVSNKCSAVPFVTWGGANSGIALWQMGKVLVEKGYELLGAAKVMAMHSMMWKSNQPVGQGHPDADDVHQVSQLVEQVIVKIDERKIGTISLELLDRQPALMRTELVTKMGQPWSNIPKSVDEKKCSQCAICKQVCPAEAVSLGPFPVFDENCFSCFSCVRECPESAIIPEKPLEAIETMIRKKVETIAEKPLTEIFF